MAGTVKAAASPRYRRHILILAVGSLWTIWWNERSSENNPLDVAESKEGRSPAKDPAVFYPRIDMVSIGSTHRPHLQDAQEQTFGTHPFVRQFVRFSEVNDTEQGCSAQLTKSQVKTVVEHCHSRDRFQDAPPDEYSFLRQKADDYVSMDFIKKKRAPASPAGWLCAQKRPIDALYNVIRSYNETLASFPDYLFIMDDDTWINLPRVAKELKRDYPSRRAVTAAGCLLHSRTMNFSYPFGGWSTIFTRKALENFVRPVYCGSRAVDRWTGKVCRRLQENQAGERILFREGMSILDLMHKYAFDQPFLNVKHWNTAGFCMHSDWVIAFFINYYYLSEHVDPKEAPAMTDVPHYRIRPYRGSQMDLFHNRSGSCKSRHDDKCKSHSHICHYVSDNLMRALHEDGMNKEYFSVDGLLPGRPKEADN